MITSVVRWPAGGKQPEHKIGRGVVLLGSGWLVEQLVVRTPALVLVAWAVFLGFAWARGERAQPPAEAVPDGLAENVAMVEFVLAVIGDRQGVHLVELLPAVQAHADRWKGCDKTFLRRALVETVGLPVRKKLRVGAVTGIPGVHRDDAVAALARLTTPPDVAAPSGTPSEDVDAGRSTREGAA